MAGKMMEEFEMSGEDGVLDMMKQQMQKHMSGGGPPGGPMGSIFFV